MYSTEVAGYQKDMRNAFEQLFLDNGVDVYLSGHIHWYERLFPLGVNATIDYGSIIDDHTYRVNEGTSMIHLINGMAGNIESHSILNPGQTPLNITASLDFVHYGFSLLTVYNETVAKWEAISGDDGGTIDYLYINKPSS